ncbi:hypothetical protein KO468_08685 [Campylobacter concisus]|uniref:hypothetical protein n=1 Tax=Campylobacter concisus TaxID=199 RepID=UPI001CE43CB0|nr:hypothetical protein [Campylobacter concisus]MCA6131004.1 hypothetical protein [Campylobacter concisus]MCA6133129.1 hypothetical protein [Campylobacter concisus]
MRKFSLFILLFFGLFSLADELNLVESFRFDGSTFYKKQVVKNESFYFLKNENMNEHFASFKVKFDKDIKTKSELEELKKALKQDKNVLFSEENDQILALIKDEVKSKNIEIIHFLLKKDGVMMLSYERFYDPKTLVDALKPVLLSEARNFMLQMPKVEAR